LKLQQEIDLMKLSFTEHEKNTERKDNVISNLSKALEKQREKTESQRVAMELKIQRVENSREVFLLHFHKCFFTNSNFIILLDIYCEYCRKISSKSY
jgi:hypothetical protein